MLLGCGVGSQVIFYNDSQVKKIRCGFKRWIQCKTKTSHLTYSFQHTGVCTCVHTHTHTHTRDYFKPEKLRWWRSIMGLFAQHLSPQLLAGWEGLIWWVGSAFPIQLFSPWVGLLVGHSHCSLVLDFSEKSDSIFWIIQPPGETC